MYTNICAEGHEVSYFFLGRLCHMHRYENGADEEVNEEETYGDSGFTD